MLKLKNTINCPGCNGILRVSAHVVSDGKEYTFFLCPKCGGAARQDPASGDWSLHETQIPHAGELVQALQGMAAEDWKARSRSRAPLV